MFPRPQTILTDDHCGPNTAEKNKDLRVALPKAPQRGLKIGTPYTFGTLGNHVSALFQSSRGTRQEQAANHLQRQLRHRRKLMRATVLRCPAWKVRNDSAVSQAMVLPS